MLASIYDKVKDIQYFLDYRADESNYGLYPQNILYCAHKLNDLYSIYCIARANLEYINNQDFGDFARDYISIKFVKTQLIMNALNYYNFLIDFSWQLIWFSIRSDLNDRLMTSKIYNDVAKECNYEVLRYNLTLLQDYKTRDYILRDFFKNDLVQEIREKWNFLKHRGSFYFEGLGENPEIMMFTFNNLRVPIVNRQTLDIDEYVEKLIKFDNQYYTYITHIVSIIFPNNFIQNRNFLNSSVNYLMEYKEQITEYNRKCL